MAPKRDSGIWHHSAAFAVGLACLTAAPGCGSLSPQTMAAHKIADALPGVIGPAQHYSVQVEGDASALTRGRARRVRVQGRNVQISPDITLDTLDFVAQDISFDTKARRLGHVGRVDFVGTLSQEHLNLYLAQSGLRPGVTITLRQSDLQVSFPITAGPIHTAVTVAGTAAPTAPGAETISFVADRARLSFLPVPVFLVNQALDRLNPVVDLSRFKVPVTLQSTDVERQTLTLRGTADLDSMTRPTGPSS